MQTADITDQKTELRVMAAEARRIAQAADPDHHAARAVSAHVLARIKLAPHAVVGGYWPIGTELDVRPLMTRLHEIGHVCGLPAIQRGQPLTFHRWRPQDKLVPGKFNILVPDRTHAVVEPDVLLMPLLAFDASGMRIGYGGGYYDRTIPAIRAKKPLLTVGIAYAAQEVSRVPTDEYDQRLDWIVTEESARLIERRRFPWLRRFFAS